MKFDNDKDFFERCGDFGLKVQGYGVDYFVDVEEVYQHFKARLFKEMVDSLTKKQDGDDD